MGVVLVVLGSLILAFTAVDVLWTTLRVGAGAGPITGRLTTTLWRGLLTMHRRSPSLRLLEQGGVLLTLSTLLLWIVLLWTGWTLIFLSAERAIIETGSNQPADLWAVIYFVGYTISDLGIGDYRPNDAVWQMLTVVASLSGISLITLSISYLVPVVSAVVERRVVADYIATLGHTPQEIVLHAREGALEQHLSTLVPSILSLAEKHRAYPVLHFFHSSAYRNAFCVDVAMLDEALTVLEWGVLEEDKLPTDVWRPVREAIGVYLEIVSTTWRPPVDTPPPPPSLEPLERAEVAVVSQAEFAQRVASLDDRRRSLKSQMLHDGYDWNRVLKVED